MLVLPCILYNCHRFCLFVFPCCFLLKKPNWRNIEKLRNYQYFETFHFQGITACKWYWRSLQRNRRRNSFATLSLLHLFQCSSWKLMSQNSRWERRSIGSTPSRKRIPASLSLAANRRGKDEDRYPLTTRGWNRHANTMVLETARFYTPLLSWR